MNKYIYLLAGLSVLLLMGGCVSMEGLIRALEPVVDGAVKMGADSAGASAQKAFQEHGGKLAEQWTGGEITAAVSGIIMTAYTGLKAAGWAYNRDPNKKTA